MSQARLAISAARRPAFNDNSTITWLRVGCAERRTAGLRRELERGFLRVCQSYDANSKFELNVMYCMAAGRSCNGNSRWLRRPERNLRVWAPNLGCQSFPHAAPKPDYAISDMTPQPTSSTQEVLAGLVERVTYHNAENGFCVLRAKARGHRDVVTVVGHAA